MLEQYMQQLLDRRQREHSLRRITLPSPDKVDFCSNDYLGLSRHPDLIQQLQSAPLQQLGATGSRLLSGHYPLMDTVETLLADFHQAPAALLFNSGYDANLSLLSCLPRRHDLLLYDALIHASLHDGMKLSTATALAFRHNDLDHLQALLQQHHTQYQHIFIVVESIYSMDGDLCPLAALADLAHHYQAYIILDEAHSTGILGNNGEGLAVHLGLEQACFARLHTFGKAIGGHGAVVLGTPLLRSFLLNFARPLIYTTALPPHSLLHIQHAYALLRTQAPQWLPLLEHKIQLFCQHTEFLPAPLRRLPSSSPIQSIVVGGNAETRQLAQYIQNQGFDIRPILSPTVPSGSERLRICLHLFNTDAQIVALAHCLQQYS